MFREKIELAEKVCGRSKGSGNEERHGGGMIRFQRCWERIKIRIRNGNESMRCISGGSHDLIRE